MHIALWLRVSMLTLSMALIISTAALTQQSEGIDLPYTVEQFRAGDIDKIIHCSGPLWNDEEHDGYLAAFPRSKSFMVRHGLNIDPSGRFTFEQLLGNIEEEMNKYANELSLLSIGFDTKLPDKTPVGLDREVSEGQFDEQLTRIAELIRDRGEPVFVRIAPEVNGFWNGYLPEYFRSAFRRIVEIFRSTGADNAITMWNYKAVPDANMIAPYIEFYPGDGYVDWWSIDLFNNDFLNAEVRQKVLSFLADAASRGKPVIIPESAPATLNIGAPQGEVSAGRGSQNHGPEYAWENWFVPYFELINSDPNIRGFCYSNRDFYKNDVTLTHWGNMRIDQSLLKDLYQHELLKPQYLHQQ